jgi:hypothetical protein
MDTAVAVSIDEWHKLKDENRLTRSMYFWVTLRDSKFHSPYVARSNRASLRCSIDPLLDRHERGVELREPKPYGATVAWLENLGSRDGSFSAVTFGETMAKEYDS